MGLALGALAGILTGLGGVPKGMAEGTAADQRQQQIDEQVRHRQMLEQQSQTDLGQLSQMLGIQVPGVQPGVRVPNAIANTVATKGLADQATTQKRAALEEQRQQVPEKYRPFLGQPGGADLAKLIYGEAVPKQAAPHYVEGPTGEITAVTVGPNGPVAQPVPGAMGKGKAAGPLVSRDDVERKMRNEGLQPGTPAWDNRYLELAQPPIAVPDVGVFSRIQAFPAAGGGQPPLPAPKENTDLSAPRTSLAEQPNVNAAGAQLAGSLGSMTAAAKGLPGVPPVPAPQPSRVAGAPGGPQPSLAFPPKQQPLPASEAEKLGTFKTITGMMDQVGKLYNPEFVGPATGRLGGLRQQTDLMGLLKKPTPQETEFRATLQSIANQLLYMRSGAAVTPQEYERIIKELPGPNDPPDQFTTKLATARKNLDMALRNREAEFSSRGFRGGDVQAPAAPAAPAAPPSQYIEGKQYKGSDGRMYIFRGGQMVPQ